ncbi:TonB family protein [Brucella sp. IR073]|uniref:TonB family protein n=1 Tax=unclassified Brucella TaxID=2632610 RepID=UPI003B980E0A
MTRSSHPDLPEGHPPVPPHSDDPQRTGWRDVALWGGAGLVMLMAHAAGAYALSELQPAPPETEGSAPPAIMMELAPEPMAPMVEEAALAPVAEAEEATEEPVEPEQTEAAEPVEEVQPETLPEEVAQAEPEPVEEVEQPEEEPVPDLVEAEKPEVVAPKPVEKPKVAEKPKPKPETLKKVEPKKVEKPKPKKQVAAAPQVDAAEGRTVAANRNSDTSGNPGVSSNRWQAKLQAHLERQKRYLQRRSPGTTGTARVTFSIDPTGNVLSVRAASGDPALTSLAEEMVRRASPVPAPPPALAKSRMQFTVPVRFK